MDRIVWHGHAFEPLDLAAWYEHEFEDRLLQVVKDLYPGWVAVKFKRTVYAPGYDPVRPDLLFLEGQCRNWYVAEVEVCRHSLSHHILPQATAMAMAQYPSSLLDELLESLPETMDKPPISRLFRSVAPGFIVIIDQADQELITSLRSVGCETSIVRVYRSQTGAHAFGRAGFVPSIELPVLSRCVYHPRPIRGLELSNPSSLPCQHLDEVVLCSERGESTWIVMASGHTKFLLAKGQVPLDEDVVYYDLCWADAHRFRLKPSDYPKRRRRP
jgi:hypothetical protein